LDEASPPQARFFSPFFAGTFLGFGVMSFFLSVFLGLPSYSSETFFWFPEAHQLPLVTRPGSDFAFFSFFEFVVSSHTGGQLFRSSHAPPPLSP